MPHNYIFLAYTNNSDIVNSFILIAKTSVFELELIVVSTIDRRKGIATELLNYFIDNYLHKNDEIYLEVSVSNKAAINLYKKFNFEVINERKKYYHDDDAYVMKKIII